MNGSAARIAISATDPSCEDARICARDGETGRLPGELANRVPARYACDVPRRRRLTATAAVPIPTAVSAGTR